MTDAEPTPQGPNLAVLKGITFGLGGLLLGGFGLLAALLIRGPQGPAAPPESLGPVPLAAGEAILSSAIEPDTVVFIVGRGEVPARLVTLSRADGTVTETPILVSPSR